MFLFILKVLISSIIISTASLLSVKKPGLAGFIIALPIASIIVLVFSYLEFQDKEKTFLFAKSILTGIPISLLFFVPFFLSQTFEMSFWFTWTSGILLIVIGFFLHKYLFHIQMLSIE